METLKQGNITDFISYLIEQVNNHSVYVWGGQGQTYPQITEKWIRERESKQGEAAATKAVNYWKKQCALGYEKVLHAYDCSGLGTYYMYNLKHLISSDTTAEGLRGMCEEVQEAKRGYFVFKQKRDGSIAARHIGYMVSDTELVHAAGEGNGIIRIKYKKSDWWKIGKPKMFSFDDPKPEPTPTPTPTPDPKPSNSYVKVLGSVNVRNNPSTTKSKVIYTAKKGEELPYLGVTETDSRGNDWYFVETKKGNGYISAFTNAKRKYTILITPNQ